MKVNLARLVIAELFWLLATACERVAYLVTPVELNRTRKD